MSRRTSFSYEWAEAIERRKLRNMQNIPECESEENEGLQVNDNAFAFDHSTPTLAGGLCEDPCP